VKGVGVHYNISAVTHQPTPPKRY